MERRSNYNSMANSEETNWNRSRSRIDYYNSIVLRNNSNSSSSREHRIRRSEHEPIIATVETPGRMEKRNRTSSSVADNLVRIKSQRKAKMTSYNTNNSDARRIEVSISSKHYKIDRIVVEDNNVSIKSRVVEDRRAYIDRRWSNESRPYRRYISGNAARLSSGTRYTSRERVSAARSRSYKANTRIDAALVRMVAPVPATWHIGPDENSAVRPELRNSRVNSHNSVRNSTIKINPSARTSRWDKRIEPKVADTGIVYLDTPNSYKNSATSRPGNGIPSNPKSSRSNQDSPRTPYNNSSYPSHNNPPKYPYLTRSSCTPKPTRSRPKNRRPSRQKPKDKPRTPQNRRTLPLTINDPSPWRLTYLGIVLKTPGRTHQRAP